MQLRAPQKQTVGAHYGFRHRLPTAGCCHGQAYFERRGPGSSVGYDCCGGVPCQCMVLYLARLDAGGNQVWSRVLFGPQDGGGEAPTLVAVRQTADGGFVTGSRIGDFSDFSRCYRYRLDSFGGFIWAQEFGSSGGFQSLFSLEATRDGGFILGGHSGQPPAGNKTSPNFGSLDFWVVKLFPEQPHLQLLPLGATNHQLRGSLGSGKATTIGSGQAGSDSGLRRIAVPRPHAHQGRSRCSARSRALSAICTSSATWKSNMPTHRKSAPFW